MTIYHTLIETIGGKEPGNLASSNSNSLMCILSGADENRVYWCKYALGESNYSLAIHKQNRKLSVG